MTRLNAFCLMTSLLFLSETRGFAGAGASLDLPALEPDVEAGLPFSVRIAQSADVRHAAVETRTTRAQLTQLLSLCRAARGFALGVLARRPGRGGQFGDNFDVRARSFIFAVRLCYSPSIDESVSIRASPVLNRVKMARPGLCAPPLFRFFFAALSLFLVLLLPLLLPSSFFAFFLLLLPAEPCSSSSSSSSSMVISAGWGCMGTG